MMNTTVITDKDNVTVYPERLREGNVAIAGYKHAAVQLICASIAINKTTNLQNIPIIKDTLILGQIISECGGKVLWNNNTLHINTTNWNSNIIPAELSEQIHGSLYLIPALAGRTGEITFYEAGGCQIGGIQSSGKRPFEHMLDVMRRFGCSYRFENSAIHVKCSALKACTIDILDYSDNKQAPNGNYVSGATKTAILCALHCLEGTTEILNPYFKPDVTELLEFVQTCGYDVVYSQNRVSITHCGAKTPPPYYLMSDISEIFTFIALSVCNKVELTLTQVVVDKVKKGMRAEILLLEKMGVQLEWGEEQLTIRRNEQLSPLDILVTSYGIYSDHHPFFTLMLLQANGVSRIEETVWKERFEYVGELIKLGAIIEKHENVIYIHPSTLRSISTDLVASELRGAAVLLLASLQVTGVTKLRNVSHIERGYECFFEKLVSLGAHFE